MIGWPKVKIMISRNEVIAVLILMATSFAFGRFYAPEKVKVIEVEKKTTTEKKDSSRESNKKIIKKKVTKPDGTVTEITREEDSTKSSRNSDKTDTTEKSKTSETTKSSSRLSIQALAGVQLSDKSLTYGLAVSRNLIGPLRIGVFGLTSGQVGCSLGLDF
jgi:hypothetical protein